jgi:hypothetical protein
MTAGNNGTNPPEGDDPFGYLYRSEDGAPTRTPQQPGVPRTSYNQVRAVGERRYGQQTQQVSNAHHAAPETRPGGHDATRRTSHGGHGGRPSQRRNGLLIGALAVVAAVIIGVGAAAVFSDDDSANASASQSASSGQQSRAEETGPAEETAPAEEAGQDDNADTQDELPSEDASSLRLDNGPAVADDIEGSKAKNGDYVGGFDEEGATATWTTDVPKAGQYRLYIGYTVPGKDMGMGLWVNDARKPDPVDLKNHRNADKGDWENGWTYTWRLVTVQEGSNSFRISCAKGDSCDVAMDRVWLTEHKDQ